MIALLRKALLAIHNTFVFLAKVLLGAMVIIIFVNVVLRYVFDSGLFWSKEISLMFVVWFTFISMAIGVRRKLHISINIFPKHMPRWFKAFITRFDNLPIIALGVVMIIWGWVLVQFTMRSILPATGIPSGVKYGVVPITGVLIIFHALVNLFGLEKQFGEEEGPEIEGEEEEGDDNA